MEFALDPLQSLNTSSADLWYAFSTAFGRRFLALVSGSQAVLYGWRGIYVPITTLTANSPSGFTYVSPSSGVDLLVVANRGSSANREINSLVYRFTQLEQLSLVSIKLSVHPSQTFFLTLKMQICNSLYNYT